MYHKNYKSEERKIEEPPIKNIIKIIMLMYGNTKDSGDVINRFAQEFHPEDPCKIPAFTLFYWVFNGFRNGVRRASPCWV